MCSRIAKHWASVPCVHRLACLCTRQICYIGCWAAFFGTWSVLVYIGCCSALVPIPGEAAAYTHRTQRGTSGERSVIPSSLPSRFSAGYFVGLGQARLCHRNKINSTSVPVGLLALGRAGGLHFDISFHPPTLSSRCGGSCPPCGSLVFARTAWTLPSIPDLPRRPRTPIVR